MNQDLGFRVTLRDPASQQTVSVRVFGTITHGGHGDDASRQIAAAVTSAATTVLSRALASQQVALPTLEMSFAHFTPQIVEAANAELSAAGLQITDAQLQCSAPPAPDMAAASAAIDAAPGPLESAASNVAGNVAASVPTHARVDVGGLRVGVGADGVNTNGLAGQVKDKIQGQVLHYAIIAGVFVFVSFICCGSVLFKFVF
jgi:site-specific recombinase